MKQAIVQIAALLKQHMGLDIATVGSALIERGVRERMVQLGQTDEYGYLHLLQSGLGELQELIELVVVPETWFFRDREAILAAARLARETIVQRPQARLRILSLPCSTGEEPYSLAMAMCDAGVPPGLFQIDAIDICRRSLALAQRAVYGRNSFRGKQLDYRERYFSTVPDTAGLWQLNAELRAQVNYRYGNMLEADFLKDEAAYDFIFCRNVLIYFDREVQIQAVDMLERLLAEQGCIFVGPAEAGLLLRPHLESLGIALSFGFRQRSTPLPRSSLHVTFNAAHKTPAAATPGLPAMPQPLPRPVARAMRPAAPVVPPAAPAAMPAVTPPVVNDLLVRARASADRGELEQALDLCQQFLREVGQHADAYYLQGLIHDARQQHDSAMQLYRKAVYLQPDHREALLQLAALLAAQGDAAAAARMQQRAERTRLNTGGQTSSEQSHA